MTTSRTNHAPNHAPPIRRPNHATPRPVTPAASPQVRQYTPPITAITPRAITFPSSSERGGNARPRSTPDRAYCDHCHVVTVFEPARDGWTACTWCGHLRPRRRRRTVPGTDRNDETGTPNTPDP